ncbi:uncharacterized protein LOC126905654 isoform X2 [Daktulosphaira vitifoliae]|uniref:uncharacterized protein LOC126905654 isoform X2 n=1 Tax=Daktulosphaira vitifoliae TaxID=58002 RepID=UPI0021AAA876|nr:uncharacterized protein LOC126905654 isoform X2 [Daktulosphaira vitifoliae]
MKFKNLNSYFVNRWILQKKNHCHAFKNYTYHLFSMFFYWHNDPFHVRVNKILSFLVEIDKRGDSEEVEKLNEIDVEKISIEFLKVDNKGEGVIDKSQCHTLIDLIGYNNLIGSTETLNKIDDESSNEALLNFKKYINNDSTLIFNLAEILFRVLFQRTQLKNTAFGKLEDGVFYWNAMYQNINSSLDTHNI